MEGRAEELQRRMRNAFSLPHIAPVFPEPPVHICGDMTMVQYSMDRTIYETLVPEPLEPAPDPTCSAWALDFFRTSGLGPYRELAFILNARLDGEEYIFSPIMILDELPALLLGREIFGVGKVMADEITYTDRNKERNWTLKQGSTEIATVTMTGDRWIDDPAELPLEDEVNRAHRKTIPSVEEDQPPAVDRLVTVEEKGYTCHWAMKGRGQVNLKGTAAFPLDLFEPVGPVEEAFRLNVEFNTHLGEVLHVYEEFNPDRKAGRAEPATAAT